LEPSGASEIPLLLTLFYLFRGSEAGRNDAEGRPSWLAQNINVGRFDYLYWLLAVLSTINLLVFVYFAKRYKYRVRVDTQQTTVVVNNKQ